MPFKHKLSRRLSVLRATPLMLLCAVAVACGDAPVDPTQSEFDGTFPNAINPSTTKVGDRVRTDRYVEVRADAPKNAKVIGSQKPGATGRIVAGPTPLTWDLYPRWQVDFDSGPDGWVYGSFLNRVDPVTPPAPTPTLTTVVVTPATASVMTGGSVQLSAMARDQNGATMSATFAWTSTSASIATVSSTGRVQGVTAGTARIIATASGRADTSVVTVTAPAPVPAPVASITVSPSSAQVLVGATTTLAATLRDANGNTLAGRTVQWNTSAASIATVSAAGLVTGVATGSVTITATSEGRSGSATVQVTAPTPPPTTGGQLTFASDWSTATGRTSAAFGDGGAWTGYAGDHNRNVDVSSAASLGLQNWPTVNAYRVGNQPTSPTSIATHQLWKDLGTPTAGSHRYYRFYMQMVYPDALGNGTVGNIEHGVESADAAMGGGDGMNLIRIPRSNGTWFLGYRDIRTAQRWYASDLQLRKNRTYRLEWHLAFSSSSYRVEIRVYDEHGALVATAADFKPSMGTGATRTLDQDQVPWTPSAGAAYRFFRIGTNGPSSNYPIGTLGGQTLYVHGAVATSSTGWAGPYRAGERP